MQSGIGNDCIRTRRLIDDSVMEEGTEDFTDSAHTPPLRRVSVDFSIGDGSVVEVKSKVRKGAVLGKWCKVAAMSTVEPGEELQDFVVVFGDGKQRIDATMKGRSDVRDAKDLGHEKMMDLLHLKDGGPERSTSAGMASQRRDGFFKRKCQERHCDETTTWVVPRTDCLPVTAVG